MKSIPVLLICLACTPLRDYSKISSDPTITFVAGDSVFIFEVISHSTTKKRGRPDYGASYYADRGARNAYNYLGNLGLHTFSTDPNNPLISYMSTAKDIADVLYINNAP